MAKKGLIYALLSALLLSTMNLFVKDARIEYSIWRDCILSRIIWHRCSSYRYVYKGHAAFPRRTGACLLCEVSMAVLAWCVTL